ncbi:MAG: tetraacyldisaccharide 4'-kinase [Caulobacterales bacterium]|nr:tetraacyldisaccharide 4'-kinase [Caulobacterales bacterium]MCA0372826.1 tetraacyldisaccharide 4'-kinase [Pseudomonadota bacterium]
MRAPSFWNIKHGRDSAPFLKILLRPLSYLYDYFTQKRIYEAKTTYLNVPVISIGNITLGGTGKTPIAIEIAKIANEIWGKPAIVSRGFGGSLIGAHKVEWGKSDPKDVGDEPLMLSKYCDVFIGKDRVEAAKLAIKNDAKAIILDDAHQNPYLNKNISFVVIDGNVGFGNHEICPAGPLRESIDVGLKRADAIIWVGKRELEKEEIGDFKKPRFYANIKTKAKELEGDYLAFCGIGRPEKFGESLKSIGARLIDLIPYPDHHFYTQKELLYLQARAQSEKLKLITTEKDYVRLPEWFAENCEVLEIAIEFDNPHYIKEFIETSLKRAL